MAPKVEPNALAPKGGTPTQTTPPKGNPINAQPKVIRTERVKLSDISTAADSGWREKDDARIEEMATMFRAGEFGVGILTIPSLLMVHGQPKLSVDDGKTLINNGMSTIEALKHLYKAARGSAAGDEQGQAKQGLQPRAPGSQGARGGGRGGTVNGLAGGLRRGAEG